MNQKSTFSISPATGMMDVLGHSGYSLNFAIADLIDNCLTAQAKNILIHLEYSNNLKEPRLLIIDDGNGMSLEQLKQAAVIGYKDINEEREEFDLGRYSTGLKSATKSLCNNVFLCSKVKNQNANTIQIDYEHIKHSGKWEAFLLDDFPLKKLLKEKGTIVYCDRLTFFDNTVSIDQIYSKLEDLQTSLQHIFFKYLTEKEINIQIQMNDSNPIQLVGWNPFDLPENKSTKVIYTNTHTYKGSKISFQSYILPVFNNLSPVDQKYMQGKGLTEQEGFYVYRNGRLIKEGGWLDLPNLGFEEKCRYARIEVDIPSTLDKDFEINFSKNSLKVPDDLLDLFVSIATRARKESRNNFNYQKHPEFKRTVKKDENQVWKISHSNIGTVLSINPENPLIKELCSSLSTNQRKKLFTTLSKSLPINMIQTQDTQVPNYTKDEMMELIDEMYNRLKKDNLELSEIKRKLGSMDPFEHHRDYLIEYFEKKEEANND